jgi:hypothetical protein
VASRGTRFTKSNDGWNAEPGAPHPEIRIEGQLLVLTFYLNPWVFPEVKVGDVGELRFDGCWRYRLGPTNDEGWWMRQCRFSLMAPDWGEFYEVEGDLRLDRLPPGAWTSLASPQAPAPSCHFLFYFKDETFECDAQSWSFSTVGTTEILGEQATLPSGSSVTLVQPGSTHQRSHIPRRKPPWFWYVLPASIRR